MCAKQDNSFWVDYNREQKRIMDEQERAMAGKVYPPVKIGKARPEIDASSDDESAGNKQTEKHPMRRNVYYDERRAEQRFMDVPGQWEDVTPPDVKKRREEEFKKFEKMIRKE